MNSRTRRILLLALTVVATSTCSGQTSDRYSLQVDILIQPVPSDRLRTQDWGKVFFNLGRRATFRKGRSGERTRLENKSTETRKSVLAVGILNRDGSISFGRETFTLRDTQPLAEWLSQLERFGAAGPPNESATWGLSDEQFSAVLKLLGTPVADPIDLRSPVESIDSLKLSSLFRIAFTDAARTAAARRSAAAGTTNDYIGLSKGSVLAAVLARNGLGFRPQADDRGNFTLEVDVGGEADNLYPVGWKNTSPITLVVPELAKAIPVDLQDAPLESLIEVIAAKLKRPHFYSTWELSEAGMDVTRIKYTRKPDKLTLYSLIDIIGKTHHLGLSLRTDETGNIFLWVTTEAEAKAFRERFAHVKVGD